MQRFGKGGAYYVGVSIRCDLGREGGYYVGVSVRCDLGREGVTMLGFLLGVTWEGRGLLCWGFC